MLKNILLVGAGGFTGSVLRYLVSLFISDKNFPWATLIINITGCFLIGLLAAVINQNNTAKLLLATGLCGGFTTFSALSLDAVKLLQQQQFTKAFLYISLSFILGICASFAGMYLIKNN